MLLAMRPGSPRPPLPVWILMFPDAQVLDVTGPLEVFALANRMSS
jgi:transcriptional regulator GlxA family with amidase domain